VLDSARFPALSLMPSCPVLMRVSGVCPRVWYGESGFDIRAKASAGPAAGARVQLHVLMVGVISVLVKLTFPHALMTARRVQQDSASRKAGRKRKALLELLDQVENIVQTRSPEPPSPLQATGGAGISVPTAELEGDHEDDQNADRYISGYTNHACLPCTTAS